jgi:hypothetical protein
MFSAYNRVALKFVHVKAVVALGDGERVDQNSTTIERRGTTAFEMGNAASWSARRSAVGNVTAESGVIWSATTIAKPRDTVSKPW